MLVFPLKNGTTHCRLVWRAAPSELARQLPDFGDTVGVVVALKPAQRPNSLLPHRIYLRRAQISRSEIVRSLELIRRAALNRHTLGEPFRKARKRLGINRSAARRTSLRRLQLADPGAVLVERGDIGGAGERVPIRYPRCVILLLCERAETSEGILAAAHSSTHRLPDPSPPASRNARSTSARLCLISRS